MIVAHFEIDTNCDFIPAMSQINVTETLVPNAKILRKKKKVTKIDENFFMTEEM